MIHHTAFGLQISATERIPGLQEQDVADATPADLHLRIQQRPYVSDVVQAIYSGHDRGKSGAPPVEVSWFPEESLYCFR